MRFSQLSRLFYEWGKPIKVQYYTAYADYLHAMLKRERVMVIEDEEGVKGIITFFITNDFNKVYKKGPWDLVNDEPSGTQIYIDKLICKKFDKKMRIAIEYALSERFPQFDEGIYHREPFDRLVRIKRRDHVHS